MDFYANLASLIGQVPFGKVCTFSSLAIALGDMKAILAIASSRERLCDLGDSPLHRVVKVQGILPGWPTNISAQKKSLSKEGVVIHDQRIKDVEQFLFDAFHMQRPLMDLQREQEGIQAQTILKDTLAHVRYIAGLDVGYSDDSAIGVMVLMEKGSLEKIETYLVRKQTDFPYIPSYLAFREAPIFEELVRSWPDPETVFLIDGHGILHPRQAGVACHVGVSSGRPTVGIAKSRLCGTHEPVVYGNPPAPVYLHGKHLGHALVPTSRSSKPIYISPGNMVSIRTSHELVSVMCRYRIPEPIRQAHLEGRKYWMNPNAYTGENLRFITS